MLLFWASGLLYSGYHLIDDHEVVVTDAELRDGHRGIVDMVITWFGVDRARGRIRVSYYLYRVPLTKLLGTAWAAWYAHNALATALATFLFFGFARAAGFTTCDSLLFSILTLVGAQTVVWFRIGLAETLGMLWLGIALVSATWAAQTAPLSRCADIAVFLSTLIASLSKESFTLFIPAVGLIRIWLDHRLNGVALSHAAVRARPILLALLVLFVVELVLIAVVAGVAGPGYAGFSVETFRPRRLWNTFVALAAAGDLWLPVALFIVTAALARRRPRPRRGFAGLGSVLLIAAAAAFPQILLYAESGMSPRYLLPALFGCTFLTLNLLDLLARYSRFWHRAAQLVAAVLVGHHLTAAWSYASLLAAEGYTTAPLFSAVETCTAAEDAIVVVEAPRAGGHFEVGLAIKRYLTLVSHRRELYVATFGVQNARFSTSAFRDEEAFWGYLSPRTVEDIHYEGRTMDMIDDKNRVAAVVLLSPERLETDFRASMADWFDLERYREVARKPKDLTVTAAVYCRRTRP